MQQLRALETKVGATFPHFVRCIKPNQAKKPGVFSSVMSLEQLRFAGVFEAVSIRKQGYPFRHSHENFFKIYRCIAPRATKGQWKPR